MVDIIMAATLIFLVVPMALLLWAVLFKIVAEALGGEDD